MFALYLHLNSDRAGRSWTITGENDAIPADGVLIGNFDTLADAEARRDRFERNVALFLAGAEAARRGEPLYFEEPQLRVLRGGKAGSNATRRRRARSRQSE